VRVMNELREWRDLLGLARKDEAPLAGLCKREWCAIEVGESQPIAVMLGEAIGHPPGEHEGSTRCL
jgi:hypothetical protein